MPYGVSGSFTLSVLFLSVSEALSCFSIAGLLTAAFFTDWHGPVQQPRGMELLLRHYINALYNPARFGLRAATLLCQYRKKGYRLAAPAAAFAMKNAQIHAHPRTSCRTRTNPIVVTPRAASGR